MSINKLLKLASQSLASGPALLLMRPTDIDGKLLGAWLQMLECANGFYCFERALHVFPTRASECVSLIDWNAASSWRYEYGRLDRGGLFVAEDVFGNQFCLLGDGIILSMLKQQSCQNLRTQLTSGRKRSGRPLTW